MFSRPSSGIRAVDAVDPATTHVDAISSPECVPRTHGHPCWGGVHSLVADFYRLFGLSWENSILDISKLLRWLLVYTGT